jgi:hypothetical protein
MRRVDQHVHVARPRPRDDLSDRNDEAGLVAAVRRQHHPHVGVGFQRGGVRIEDVLPGRRLRHHESRHSHASSRGEPVHRVLHAGIVEVRVQHRVAGFQAVVSADQHLHRFGGARG